MPTPEPPLPEGIRAGSVFVPESELRWRFSRSSGPGGQGVNTTDSRVELVWDLATSPALPEPVRLRAIEQLGSRLVDGTIVIAASEYRSQLRNRAAARARLASILAVAIQPPTHRRRTRPTRASVRRRVDGKKRTSQTKQLRRRPDL
jgi:ribosome-associated protein